MAAASPAESTPAAAAASVLLERLNDVAVRWRTGIGREAEGLTRVAEEWEADHAAIAAGFETWADAARALESHLVRAEARSLRHLVEALEALDVGASLEGVAAELIATAREMAAGASESADFLSSMMAGPLPRAVEEVVTGAARQLLGGHAGVARETTRWARTMRRLLLEARAGVGETSGPVRESASAKEPATKDPSAQPGAEWVAGLVQAGQAVATETRALVEGLRSVQSGFPGTTLEEVIAAEVLAYREPDRDPEPRQEEAEVGTAAPVEDHPAAEEPSLELRLADRFGLELARVRMVGELVALDVYLLSYPEGELLVTVDAALSGVAEALTGAVEKIRRIDAEVRAALTPEGTFAESPDVTRLLRAARSALAMASRAVEGIASSKPASSGSAEGLRALVTRLSELPGPLRVSVLGDAEDRVRLRGDAKEVDVRAWAQEAFGPAVLDRLGSVADPCERAIREALDTLPGALDVLEYNLGAATADDEFPPEEAEKLKVELVLGGLTRTADRVEGALDGLAGSRDQAVRAATAAVREGARRLRRRVEAEGRVAGQARDALGAAQMSGRRIVDGVAEQVDRGLKRVRVQSRLLRRKARRAFGRARSAVGATPIDAHRKDVTIQAIADLDRSARDLPFVYRRLFSYRPLEDPTLLVGRGAETKLIDQHLERWQAEAASGLLLVVTSFLRATRERWAGRVEWCDVSIPGRVEDEAEWAAILGEVLDLQPRPRTLAEVEEGILARDRPAVARVCAVERLEHLYFRGILAQGLIAPTFKLFSATDTAVLWIASMPASAWEVVQATDPGLSALLKVVPISALGRDTTEAAIMARHRRSGIPIRFEESAAMPPLARRAAAKATSPRERRRVVQKAFFDRLYALSEGHAALAMLYWLRSIRLDAETNGVVASWPETLDFSAWDGLPSDVAFALRAFLEHGTLTVSEYGRLFGVGESEGFAMFERLGAMLVIEADGQTRPVGERLSFTRVDPKLRYRLRPVLIRPVARLLISRRLLY